MYGSKDSSETFFDTTNSTRAKLIKNAVYPDKVSSYAERVLEGVEPGLEGYRYAAALTRFVFREVENVEDSNQSLYRPDYVLDYGVECDCEDKAVLICSLLESQGFNTRFVGVVDEEFGNHLMVQVSFPEKVLEGIESVANDFYGEDFPGELSYQEDVDGVAWLLCDPVFSPVVGCCNSDFFEQNSSGVLRFRDGTRHDYIDVEDETVIFMSEPSNEK